MSPPPLHTASWHIHMCSAGLDAAAGSAECRLHISGHHYILLPSTNICIASDTVVAASKLDSQAQACVLFLQVLIPELEALNADITSSAVIVFSSITRSDFCAVQVLMPQLEALNADITVLAADTDSERRKREATSREVTELKDRLQQVNYS